MVEGATAALARPLTSRAPEDFVAAELVGEEDSAADGVVAEWLTSEDGARQPFGLRASAGHRCVPVRTGADVRPGERLPCVDVEQTRPAYPRTSCPDDVGLVATTGPEEDAPAYVLRSQLDECREPVGVEAHAVREEVPIASLPAGCVPESGEWRAYALEPTPASIPVLDVETIGDRRLRPLQLAGGATAQREFLSFAHDKTFGVSCRPARLGDGVLRCYPASAMARWSRRPPMRFADPACSQPAHLASAGEGCAPAFVALGESPPTAACGGSGIDRIWRPTERIEIWYVRNATTGACVERSDSWSAVYRLEPVPPESFMPLRREVE